MKFNSDLDHYENWNAWEEHRSNSVLSSKNTRYNSLTEGEKAWLRAFNESLRQIEDKFYSIMDAKHKEFQARVADPSDWLMEFNLDFFITFYLREDDPEYEEDDDNILMEFRQHFYRESHKEWGFGAIHVDHAEPGQDFTGEQHCYLYHQLYDHCGLDWRDLFRIGNLWVDIKIDEQSWLPDLGFIPYEQKT